MITVTIILFLDTRNATSVSSPNNLNAIRWIIKLTLIINVNKLDKYTCYNLNIKNKRWRWNEIRSTEGMLSGICYYWWYSSWLRTDVQYNKRRQSRRPMVKGTVDQSIPWQIVIYQSAICPILRLLPCQVHVTVQGYRRQETNYSNHMKIYSKSRMIRAITQIYL